MNSPSFIYTKRNILSPELCKKFINTFNKSEDTFEGITSNIEYSKINRSKKSTDITFNPSFKDHPQWGELLKPMIFLLKQQVKNYQSKYFKIKDEKRKEITSVVPDSHLKIDPYFNMQYYKPGEGFYGWHSERSCIKNTTRILTWMFFLNNVTDGGGTQFYHQNHTEPAEQGKIVIFSSDYFHTHRGEVSKTQDKYILTGWVNLKN
tara:strand:- start:3392 stop:4009 length:618 start_codon:yes stop_codon:yes gene_type:complete